MNWNIEPMKTSETRDIQENLFIISLSIKGISWLKYTKEAIKVMEA